MEQGTISTWLKQEGEAFEAGDVICQVETDKATVDFEAQDDGVIAKIVIAAGTEVKVGEPIMVVVESGDDVAAFADFAAPAGAAAAAAAPAPVDGGDYVDFPVTEDAMALAAQFAQTKKEVPHYYLSIDLKLDNLLKVREELNDYVGSGDLSMNDLVLKAAALTMRDVPDVNASWHGTFVRQYKRVDVNVLVNTDGGVVAPVIRDAGAKGLGELSGMVKCKVAGVEQGTLAPEDYQAGTFSVANLGAYGVKSFSPIVMAPQACMLALGAAETRIVPSEDPASEEIYQEATVLTATLSCDHRVVDGAVGAQWLAAFKKYVENPMSMLL